MQRMGGPSWRFVLLLRKLSRLIEAPPSGAEPADATIREALGQIERMLESPAADSDPRRWLREYVAPEEPEEAWRDEAPLREWCRDLHQRLRQLQGLLEAHQRRPDEGGSHTPTS